MNRVSKSDPTPSRGMTLILLGALFSIFSGCSAVIDTNGKQCNLDSQCGPGQICNGTACVDGVRNGDPAGGDPQGGDTFVGDNSSCTSAFSRQCVGGDVHSFDSCGNDEGLDDDCNDHQQCVDVAANSAQCQCLTHWSGDECDTCPENWDATAQCNACLPGWDGSECDACAGNWTGDNCDVCVDGWANKDDNCGTCVRYVDAAGSNGNGSSWFTAQTSIQAGINAAWLASRDEGDPTYCEVWVKTGSYAGSGSGQNATVLMQPGVHLYGGFPSAAAPMWRDRDPGAHPTTIDGSGAAGGAFHVVTGANNAVLDGFIITGGRANGEFEPDAWGAGMLNDGVSPTVANCRFDDNRAVGYPAGQSGYGGAMYNYNGASPNITDTAFVNNSAQYGGGAVINKDGSHPIFTGCHFERNSVTGGMGGGGDGGGMRNDGNASPVIIDTDFVDNSAQYGHGGALLMSGGVVSLHNCEIRDNDAGDGGGIYVSGGTATLTQCSLINNHATGDSDGLSGNGGGLYSSLGDVTVEQCEFSNNQVNTVRSRGGGIYAGGRTLVINSTFHANASNGGAYGQGGGIYMGSTVDVTVANCTFYANVSSSNEGSAMYIAGGSPVVFNSILWGDPTAALTGYSTSTIIEYNIIHNGPFSPGDSNFYDDPAFVGNDPYDLHLQTSSPAIDAGWPVVSGIDAPNSDLEGNARPSGSGWDLGAYEMP